MAFSRHGAAMRFFRPEFFNRMDQVVTFQPLKPEGVKALSGMDEASLVYPIERFVFDEAEEEPLVQPVHLVSHDRVPTMLRVHLNLVEPPGAWAGKE